MIEVRDLRKRYFRKAVLNGVSFTAEAGQITCLAGLNGAGKSTVLKAIMGLVPLDGGSILVGGTDVSRHHRGNGKSGEAGNAKPAGKPAELNRFLYNRVSFIPDRLPMPPSMTLREAMRFMADFYPETWNEAKAREMLAFFGLAENNRVSSLSKGNAAKFNLLLGLALDTEYVLMDEPFSGIDLFSREAIADVFSNGWLEDRGVLMTTHEIHEVEHLIDKVVLLKDGTVVKQFFSEDMRMAENKSIVDVMREVYLP